MLRARRRHVGGVVARERAHLAHEAAERAEGGTVPHRHDGHDARSGHFCANVFKKVRFSNQTRIGIYTPARLIWIEQPMPAG